jgi:hypothetical protein
MLKLSVLLSFSFFKNVKHSQLAMGLADDSDLESSAWMAVIWARELHPDK